MDNKSFCAEEISGLIQELDHNFSEYEDKADLFISYCNEFRDNDSYQGTNAVAAKIIVGEKEVEIANLQKGLHTKLLDMYKHVAQSFADKVDSAPNARLDLDALTISENGLKSIYGKMDDYCCKFENIAKEMQNKYGHIGNITVPDCNPLRESMINLCGGDVDNAGFLYELKQKLINFDEEECAYIDSLNFEDDIKSVNNGIINVNNTVFNTQNYDPIGLKNMLKKHLIALNNKLLFTSDDGMGAVSDNDGDLTSNYNADDIILGIIQYYYKNNVKDKLVEVYHDFTKSTTQYRKEFIFSSLQERYGFSSEEINKLKDKYEKELMALYWTTKCNSTEADRIYNNIKDILSWEGLDYLLEAYYFVEESSISDEQKEKVFRLDKLIKQKYDDVDYDCTVVASLEIFAAALYEHGYSDEFISCVLGNCGAEFCIGGIEDSTGRTDEYILAIENHFAKLKHNFQKLYAKEKIYELNDNGYFLKNLEEYAKNRSGKIIGIGNCQWTYKGRLPELLNFYKDEMGIDRESSFDRDITFIEAARAESKYIIYELESDSGSYSYVDDDFERAAENMDFSEISKNEDFIKDNAEEFGRTFEVCAPSSYDKRKKCAWNIYRTMKGVPLDAN